MLPMVCFSHCIGANIPHSASHPRAGRMGDLKGMEVIYSSLVHRFMRAAREADSYWLSTSQAPGKPRQTVRSEIKTNQGQTHMKLLGRTQRLWCWMWSPPGLHDWSTYAGRTRSESGLYLHSPQRHPCVLLRVDEA